MSNCAMSNETELDWLARNVHKWPAGDHQPWCYVYMTYGGVMKAAGNFLDAVANPAMITIDQWLTRRAELQNKPSWDLSGSWSKYLAQDMDGEWKWLGENPSLGDEYWTADELRSQCKGVVIGDWRDTLEKRPETYLKSMSGVHSNGDMATLIDELNDIDESVFGDGFLHKNAATAKQPAPKGSGNPILGMVLADLANRALEGKEKYGEPLLAHNGRNPLWDAYQEALDLAMYLRQAIEELG